VGTGSLLRE